MIKTVDLHNYIGSILKNITIELYIYRGEKRFTINDVQLNIGNNNFIFCCSGDGSIFVKRGDVVLPNNDDAIVSSKLYEFDSYNGFKIEKIEIMESSIVIKFKHSAIEIINEDDDLVIMDNGKELSFDM